jgi:hypothetical protein
MIVAEVVCEAVDEAAMAEVTTAGDETSLVDDEPEPKVKNFKRILAIFNQYYQISPPKPLGWQGCTRFGPVYFL